MDFDSVQDFAAAEAAATSNPSSLTYADLRTYFLSTEALTLKPQQQSNRQTALNKFQQYVNKSNLDPIGQELAAAFAGTLSAFLKAEETSGMGKGSLANLKTWLHQWRKTWIDFLAIKNQPDFETPAQAILFYLDKTLAQNPSLTQRAISLACGWTSEYLGTLRTSYVQGIRTGSINRKSEPNMIKLEAKLGAPPGTFTRFLMQKRDRTKAKRLTTFRKTMLKALASPYFLGDWPTQLKSEMRALVQFKTDLSVTPLLRNKMWKLEPKEKFSSRLVTFDICSPDGLRFSASAHAVATQLRGFFGALVQLGYDPEKFSLAYLSDFALIKKYLNFMRGRHDEGALTKTATNLIITSKSLLLEKRGYLRQLSFFAERLVSPVTRLEWDQWCAGQRASLEVLEKELNESGQVQQGRNVKEPIQEILELEHPVTALFTLIENMETHLEEQIRPYRPGLGPVFERDLLLIKILSVQPLRIKMFRDMKYFPDNTGSLYQRFNGAWAIRFSPREFKNEKGAAKKPYDVPLPERLWQDVSHYIKNIRPLFKDDRPNVFVAMPNHKKLTETSTLVLSKAVHVRTEDHLPNSSGFGPHSFRHIIATEYIKNNPNGFQVAADVLHDKLETVLRHYAHLKAEDGHKHWLKHLDTVLNDWKKAA